MRPEFQCVIGIACVWLARKAIPVGFDTAFGSRHPYIEAWRVMSNQAVAAIIEILGVVLLFRGACAP